MEQYLALLRSVLEKGEYRQERTGVGTYALFGAQARYDLTQGFPLVTTKKVHLKSIIYELLWFLKGDTNNTFLENNGITIWKPWADSQGNLGRIYGAQWCDWRTPQGGSINQINEVIKSIRTNPFGRRHIVSAWNPGELDTMALPPCHALFQFYVSNDGGLSCQLYQRSADLFLGVPFNIASYALLTSIIAHICNLKPKELVHSLGDHHIYANHRQQVELQLSREPKPLPTLVINPQVKNIHDLTYEDFKLIDYNPHPAIRAAVAV